MRLWLFFTRSDTPRARWTSSPSCSSARARSVCVMCAEAQWWRCHRRLLADALTVRGWQVLHLGLGGAPVAHELTPFAVLGEDRALTYPPLQAELRPGA